MNKVSQTSVDLNQLCVEQMRNFALCLDHTCAAIDGLDYANMSEEKFNELFGDEYLTLITDLTNIHTRVLQKFLQLGHEIKD
jgi:hypothetical protein